MRFLFFFFCLVIAFKSQAQDYAIVEPSNVSFAIRGKYLLGGILEDLYWRAYNYGGEVIIGKHHAIGIDGGMFRTRFENDDSVDVAMFSEIERRTYIYLDYKFMLHLNPQVVLYAQVFSKLNGKMWQWDEPTDYDFKSADMTYFKETSRGNFSELGGGFGTKIYFGTSNFGFDANLNIAKRFGSFTSSNYDGNGNWEYSTHDETKLKAYLRISFFYHFYRFKI
jgi:hypothetical protein